MYFVFMPDVGMGYVSLDPYTLFACFLAWPSLHPEVEAKVLANRE